MTSPTRRAERYYSASWFPGLGGGTPPPLDPVIGALIPASGPAGVEQLLRVTGSNFLDGAVIEVAQVAQATTFVDGSQLSATITPAEGPQDITVRNPNEEESNSVVFTGVAAGTAAARAAKRKAQGSK